MEHKCKKLLLFGGLPATYMAEWEITSDVAFAEPKLGIQFDLVSHDELVARYELD